MGRIEGKVAIVTGAASGLGRASARLLAQEGAKVVAADLDRICGEALAEEINHAGGTASFMEVDVTEPERMRALVDTTLATFERLDVLFNNAGIAGEFGDTVSCSLENWRQVMDVNLNAVFYGLKYAIPAMLKGGGGSIINTASVLGMVAMPESPAYAASKGAVIQLTKAAALEGVRINAICPGTITTSMYDRMVAADPGWLSSCLLWSQWAVSDAPKKWRGSFCSSHPTNLRSAPAHRSLWTEDVWRRDSLMSMNAKVASSS